MSSTYYVRARGRISGPFDTSSLQRMVRRGLLSRVHEVSADKQQWMRAADLPEVFVAPRSPQDQPIPLDDVEQTTSPDNVASEQSHGGVGGAQYYYAQAGTTVGPLSLPVLKALAQNGTLGPDDMVWREGAEVAAPACQLTPLAGIFGLGRSPAASGGRPGSSSRTPAFVRLREQVRETATIIGFVIGGALLLLVNLPLFQIHDKTVFWWHIASADGATGFMLNCVYVLLVSVTLCVIAALLQGRARSLVYITLAGVGLAMWAFLPLFSGGPADPSAVLSALLLIPALAAMCLSIARFRGVSPDYAPARVLLTTVGSVLALISFGAGISLLVNMSDEWTVMPGWANAVLVIIALSCLTGLATGVFGIVNVKPTFSAELNLTVNILASATLLLSVVYATILVIGASDEASKFTRVFGGSGDGLPSSAAIGFLLFRIAFVFYAFVALLGNGVIELLVTLADQPAHPVRRTRSA